MEQPLKEETKTRPWIYYVNLVKKLSKIEYGKSNRILFQAVEIKISNDMKWIAVRVAEVNKDKRNDNTNATPSTPIQASLFQCLRDRDIFNPDIWLFFHSSDPFLIIRSDRFVSKKTYPHLFEEGYYMYMSVSPVDRQLKAEKGKENILCLNELKGDSFILPTTINYWKEHHNRDSPFYLCDWSPFADIQLPVDIEQ